MPNPATDVADDEKTETLLRKRNNFVQLVVIKEQKKKLRPSDVTIDF